MSEIDAPVSKKPYMAEEQPSATNHTWHASPKKKKKNDQGTASGKQLNLDAWPSK